MWVFFFQEIHGKFGNIFLFWQQGEDLQSLLQMDLSQENEEKYAVDIRHSAIQVRFTIG